MKDKAEVYSMYDNNLQTQARKEKEDLELQINNLITDYEKKWRQHWTKVTLFPVTDLKNNLPYNLQKGGRLQFYL